MSTFGVTVLPEWAQSEGIEPLLDRLEAAGVTEIATSPYVMEPSEGGVREPPGDGGAGSARLLDRELWGRREITVATAPSFEPDLSLYEGLRYRPPAPGDLTRREGGTVARFIEAAQARGLKAWLQVQSAIPPGYRVQFGGPRPEDAPLGPDGEPVPGRVDANASLAAPEVLDYGCALLRDLARAYPTIDGVRIDWPEYPPYAFGSLFFDFSPHALREAEALGFDTTRMRRDALSLRERLRGLPDALLARAQPLDAGLIEEALARYPGALDLMALRRHLCTRLVARHREALPPEMALVPQAFPPPLNLLSGFDFAATSGLVEGIGVKLYTMHWPMILADWGAAMAGGRPDTGPLAAALVTALDAGGAAPRSLADLRYPAPDEPHPCSAQAIASKIAKARAGAGRCPVYALTHGYGPPEDVIRRARAAWEASDGMMWVNRYGYLSDEKLSALGMLVRG